MAADDPSGRVIYVGTFDMTISPALGLGFVVAPLALAARFGEVAGHLNPAPNATTGCSSSSRPISATRSCAIAREISTQLRRSDEHTSELQSLMSISYAVFCCKKKNEL